MIGAWEKLKVVCLFCFFTNLVYIGRGQSLLTWSLVPRISLYCCLPEDDLTLSLLPPFPTCWDCSCELLGADNFSVMFCFVYFVLLFIFAMLGIKPKALEMLVKHSVTEHHSRPFSVSESLYTRTCAYTCEGLNQGHAQSRWAPPTAASCWFCFVMLKHKSFFIWLLETGSYSVTQIGLELCRLAGLKLPS